MVQVLSCHHFKSQTVVSPSHEPLVVFAADGRLFVATSQRVVEVYQLDGAECTLIHTLKTVGVTWKGTFNQPGNYVALLEDENGKSNKLRVYFNWELGGTRNTVMKARLAGSSSPVKCLGGDTVEVVEVLTKHHVKCLACCKENGNLVVGMRGIISIFHLTGEPSRHDFKHFLDIVVEDFKVLNVDILGAHLVFTSAHEAHVLLLNSQKFHISCPSLSSDDQAGSVPETAASSAKGASPHVRKSVLEKRATDSTCRQDRSQDGDIVNDEHFVEWTFGATSASRVRCEWSQSEQGTRDRLILPSIMDEDYVKQKEGPAEILGPVNGIPGIAPFKIRHAERGVPGKRSGKVQSYVHLLYCRFPKADAGLMSAQLLPNYIKVPFSLGATVSSEAKTSDSFRNRQLSGLCCLLSTPKQGLVYDILGRVRPLSCYLYTAEAISLEGGEDFLYAVTSSGLGTFSHRVAAAAIHNTQSIDDEANACPDPTTDICMLGSRPFMGARAVTSCDSHVILLCKMHDDEDDAAVSDWNVYVLQKATLCDIHTDMIEMAAGIRQASMSTYRHVIMEAHLLARSRLMRCCHGRGGEETPDSDEAEREDGSRGCAEMRRMYRETSSLLGKIYAESTVPSEWPLTLPYLRMSSQSIAQILVSITGPLDEPYDPESVSLGPGLVSFLDFRLFSDESQELAVDTATSERIVEVCCHHKPQQCSEIFLSGKLRGHLSAEKRLDILHKLKQKQLHDEYQWSSKDSVAMVLIHLELGDMEQARFAASCLTPAEVIQLIPASSDLFLDMDKQLTDFSRLLCKESLDSMVEVLIRLLDNDKLNLGEATTVLKNAHGGSMGSSLLLTRLLESILCDAKWHAVFQEAMREIVPIYLGQLLETDHPSLMNTSRTCRRTHAHVPQGNGCFAARFNWLNKLPPFQGSLRQTCTSLEQKARSWRLQRGRSGSVTQPQTPTKTGANCPCCCCNEVLMRLQSLLCSDHLPEEVASYVVDRTEDMKEVRGRGSLHLLCHTKLDIKSALSVVIHEFPSIAVEFSSQHCGHSQEMWSHVLGDLVRGLEEKTTDGMETRKAVSLQMLSGVLGYLVQELDASSLLALLPSDLPLSLTMPYIERSLLRDRAKRLRDEIVASGLATVTGR